jgi:phosphatidylserine/phosphatidylglycerophosphate/cardiolipin synthase-like enzyme
LLFDDAIKELTKAARKENVRVRVVVNAADRSELEGRLWDEFFAAGGEVRFKQTNADAFQIMHHKLVVLDGETLIVGSGNWSGSAFFNNWEFYVRNRDAQVVQPFSEAFERLWSWSLTGDSLDRGLTGGPAGRRARRCAVGRVPPARARLLTPYPFRAADAWAVPCFLVTIGVAPIPGRYRLENGPCSDQRPIPERTHEW